MKVKLTEQQFRRVILREQSTPTITINDSGVKGTYIGPSKNPGDKTHAFANTISTKVGEKLKDLYDKQIWTKVDLDGIKLETVIDKSLGTKITTNSGDVKFTIDILLSKLMMNVRHTLLLVIEEDGDIIPQRSTELNMVQ